MMGHKICFNGKIWKIIPKLSLLPLLIWSTGKEQYWLLLIIINLSLLVRVSNLLKFMFAELMLAAAK